MDKIREDEESEEMEKEDNNKEEDRNKEEETLEEERRNCDQGCTWKINKQTSKNKSGNLHHLLNVLTRKYPKQVA